MSNNLESVEPFLAQAFLLEDQLLSDMCPANKLDNYISEGSCSFVYGVDQRPDLVMRLPYVNHDSRDRAAEEVEHYRQALTRGLGQSGLEQIVAFSHGYPAIVVSQYAGSRNLEDIRQDGSVSAITIPKFKKLLKAFEAMQQRRLTAEHVSSNVVANNTLDLTLIDYVTAEEYPQSLGDKIVEFAGTGMLIDHHYDIDFPAQLPAAAITYRQACLETFGELTVEALNAYWYELGFSIPDLQ